MDELLKDLNERQREAVLASEGPVLILAGPGSGKTKTLTHRIAYLILQKEIPPAEILAVTFTNKAAEEMKTRISALTRNLQPTIYNLPFVGTFHAFSLRILRAHAPAIGYLAHFTIFDEDDSLGLMKEALNECSINPKQFPAGMILHAVSGLKNELVTPERYEEEYGTTDLFPHTIHKAYLCYQKRLRESNAMDFDDLLMNTVALFEKHPNILALYQGRFRYIHVDEWQDTNHVQYVLISQLAQKYRNLAVVGDDAQSIYGFRGADFRNIMKFEKDWPEAKVVVLDQNYRSTQTILDAAREVIAKNRAQKEKKLWTEGEHGDPIEVNPAGNEREEAEAVFEKINTLKKQNVPLKDIAVLYRTNAQSRILEEIFLDHNFPYKITGGVRFYQRKEVKDILAYVRFLINPKDLIALKRIINVPARGIGKKAFLVYLAKLSSGNGPPLSARPEAALRLPGQEQGSSEIAETHYGAHPALEKFEGLLAGLQSQITQQKPTDFLKHLLKAIMYQEYLDDSSTHAEERWQNVQELVSFAKKYDLLTPPDGLMKLLEDAALMSEADEVRNEEEGVRLMTLHAAKGLEFSYVFMVGLEEGIFPHSRSLFNPQELEEERRLCYVGLTRAKKRVFLSFALRRTQFGATQINPPSRFLGEIPEHLLDVSDESTIEV